MFCELQGKGAWERDLGNVCVDNPTSCRININMRYLFAELLYLISY